MPSKRNLKVSVSLQKQIMKRRAPEDVEGMATMHPFDIRHLVPPDRHRNSRIRRRLESAAGKSRSYIETSIP